MAVAHACWPPVVVFPLATRSWYITCAVTSLKMVWSVVVSDCAMSWSLLSVGAAVGIEDGSGVGVYVGIDDGMNDGGALGAKVGTDDGADDGTAEGLLVGSLLGLRTASRWAQTMASTLVGWWHR